MKELATSQCDLSIRLHESTNDEIKEMTEWFNSFIEKLKNILVSVTGLITQNDAVGNGLSISLKDSAEAVSQRDSSDSQVNNG